jgi:hypothetical protein
VSRRRIADSKPSEATNKASLRNNPTHSMEKFFASFFQKRSACLALRAARSSG